MGIGRSDRKVCVRWLEFLENPRGGHSDEWVARSKMFVLNRERYTAVRNKDMSITQAVQVCKEERRREMANSVKGNTTRGRVRR